MAKYTELFNEWLEAGGELPPEFSQIADFDNLFVGEYADSELGYETPTLFQLKLNQRAALVMPDYIIRIEEIQRARILLQNPTKIRTKTGQISRMYGGDYTTGTTTQNGRKNIHTEGDTTNSAPDHVRTIADQPFIAQTEVQDGLITGAQVTPTQISVDRAFENDTTHVNNTVEETYDNYTTTVRHESKPKTDTEFYDDITDKETGYTVDEAERIYKDYERAIFNIKKQLLAEFKNLFMLVY